MCGICGLLAPGTPREEAGETVREMMRRLEHRGPDGGGSWQHGPVTLGHRRLSIIDLEGGYQPLLNETGDVGVVFNGEIYNYRELRAVLAGRGHTFRSESDTEVLVHGFEEWGDDFVHRLRGMFAFGVWDGRGGKRRLLLGRDRLGVKSLYYRRTDRGSGIAFASEIKALFCVPGVERRLNADRVPEYLMFRAIVGEQTLFDGVSELEPGTLLSIEDGRAMERRYWQPASRHSGIGDAEPLETGRALLSDAVRARLVSDVPLGTITSGGLDSSLVSALCAEQTNGPVDTFCVGFQDPAYDERPYARLVADQIGSVHHDIEVVPGDIDAEMDRLTWAHDEPLSHPNSVPMHLIFRYAKEVAGVTVLLSGEGADEVFGGYEWYSVAHRRDRLRRVPGLRAAARLLPFGKLATLARVLHPDYLSLSNALTPPSVVSRLLASDISLPESRAALLVDDSADQLFVYDQQSYLLPLLQRQDRMSMAAGLEARVPFLDHALVEWANGLDLETKLPGGRRKELLKQMAGSSLPDSIIRRKKVGFAMPLGEWLRAEGTLGHRVKRVLERDSIVRQIADVRIVERLVREHDTRQADHTDLLWSLVALDTWAGAFLGSDVHEERLPGADTGRDVVAVAEQGRE
jgi:asparagine synthase (glutamine-hydrolysing)